MDSSRNDSWSLVLGLGGLLCLYPVFFLYHGMLAFNLLPRVVPLLLGGLFGHVSALILLFYTLFQLWSRFEKRNFQKTDVDCLIWLFLAYISWALIWTGINVGFFYKDYTSQVAIKLFKDLVLQSANFIVGSFLVLRPTKTLLIILSLFWVCMMVFVFANYNPNFDTLHRSLLLDPSIKDLRGEEISFASHQGFARSTLITSFLLISFSRAHLVRFCLVVVSFLALFVIGARSEMLAFLIAVICLEVAFTLFVPKQIWRLIVVWLPMSLFVIFAWAALIQVQFSAYKARMLAIFNPLADTSWNSRLEQFSAAFKAITDNPLLGDFGSHLRYGNHGDIPHNILASWTMLGFPGFLMMILLLIGSCYYGLRFTKKDRLESPLCRFTFMLGLASTPLVLAAKSSFLEWLPLFFGCVIALAKEDGRKLKSM